MHDTLHILIVEDLLSDADLAERELRRAGLSFVSERVETRDAYVKALKEFHPDLILADYSLPSFDGITALRIAREDSPTVPFILTTGSLNEEIAVECMKAGATDYVLKEHLTRLGPATRAAIENQHISEAKLVADANLRESMALYQTLFESSLDAILLLREDKFIDANPKALELYGCRRDDLVLHAPGEFSPLQQPDGSFSAAQASRRIGAALKGEPQHFEWKHRRRDGQEFDTEISLTRMELHGQPFVQAIIRDITEKKHAEKALRESENRFRSLVTNVGNIAVQGYAPDGTINFWNYASEVMYGYTAEEALGENLVSLVIPSAMQPGVRKAIAEMTESGEGRPAEELVLRRKDGSPLPVYSSHAVMDIPGRGRELFCIDIDLRDRKKAEDALRASESRYRQLFECNPQPMWVLEKKTTRFLAVNDAAVTHYGYAREEFLSMTVHDIHVPEVHQKLTDTLAKDIDVVRRVGIWQHKRKDGSLIDVDVTTHDIDFDGKPCRLVLATDVTEKLRALAALRESEQRHRALAYAIPDQMFRLKLDGTVVDARLPEGTPVYMQPKDLLNKRLPDVLPSDLGLRVTESIKTAYQTGGMAMIEYGLPIEGVQHHFEARFVRLAEDEVLLVNRDITERKKGELELKESRNKYSLLLQQIQVGVVSHAPDSSILLSNPLASELLGLTPDQMQGKKAIDTAWYFIREDGSRMLPEEYPVARALASDVPISNLVGGIIRPGKKNPVWVQCDAHKILDNDGKLQQVLVTFFDITERKEAERALRESETRYRAVLNSANDAIVSMDSRGKIVGWNDGAERLFGYRYTEAVGLPLSSLLTPGHRAEEKVIFDTLVSGQRGPGSRAMIESEGLRRDGTQFPADLSFSQWEIEEGHFFTVIVRDMTERRESEETLRTLRKALETSGEAIFITKPDGIITYVNPGFTDMYGYTSDEVIGRATPRILKSGLIADKDYASFWTKLQHGEAVRGQLKNKTKDGRLLDVDSSSTPILDEKKGIIGFLGIQRNISEWKSLEQQLWQAQKLESIGTLASGIAHDFNNVLSIVLGYVSLLRVTSSDQKKVTKSVDAIENAVQRGTGLVRQILTFARKTEPTLTPCDVNAIVSELEKMIRETFPRNITIATSLEPKLESLLANSTQMHQTLLNLCVNARDAMPEGGKLTISVKGVTAAEVRKHAPEAPPADYVYLRVSDTGSGMDQATVQKIFEPFFTTKEPGKGTGLGLAVVYGIVNSHRGYIDVESTPGKGTTFHLYFPRFHDHEDRIDLHADAQTAPAGGAETILLIEDESILRELMTVTLESVGYKVLAAADGEEGVKLFEKHHETIGLVVLDFGLPKMNGAKVVAEMKKLVPKVKVLITSGYVDPEVRSRLLRAGAKGFVQKPYQLTDILKKVRETLDNGTHSKGPVQ